MRRSKTYLFWALGLGLAIALLAGLWWWRAHRRVPAAITQTETAFEFAIYFLPKAPADALAAVDEAARAFPEWAISDGQPGPAAGQVRVFRSLVDDVAKSYAPPDGQSLRLFARGLTPAQQRALGLSRQALRLQFRVPPGRALDGLRGACQVTLAVARRTGGLLWDQETREVFTPKEWESRRVEDWPASTVPDVSRQVVIHSYRSGDYLRAITLGMAKLGLPDLVVESFASSNSRSMGNLLNLTAQALAEGAAVRDGEFTLRIAALRHPRVRAEELASLKPHAKDEVVLRLREGRADEGDPANRLLEIGFDRYEGPDPRARQDRLLGDLFGWEDAVAEVRHDDVLLAASRKARERLPVMKTIMAGGLEPGQILMVKAPFAKPDGGAEWMWVEVVGWRGSRIRGVLTNEPFGVPGLRAGQEVVVAEADVFDYLLQNPDGTEEGNETSIIIEAQTKAP